MAKPSPGWGPKGVWNSAPNSKFFHVLRLGGDLWFSEEWKEGGTLHLLGQWKGLWTWSQEDPCVSPGCATAGALTVGKPHGLVGHPRPVLQGAEEQDWCFEEGPGRGSGDLSQGAEGTLDKGASSSLPSPH